MGCEQATAAFVARQMSPRLRLEGIDFAYVAERDASGPTSLPLDELFQTLKRQLPLSL